MRDDAIKAVQDREKNKFEADEIDIELELGIVEAEDAAFRATRG